MADRETTGLRATDRRIIEEIFRVRVAERDGDGKRPCASWQEHLGIYILENGGDAPGTWEPFSPSRDIALALQALHALVRRGWRYDLRVTSARAVLYLSDGSHELEGVAPLRSGNLTAALPVAISRGVARALEDRAQAGGGLRDAGHAGRSDRPPNGALPASLPAS